jgi:hypothetical protein
MSTDKEVDVLGIDISKAKFDVALLKGKDKIKNKVFTNNLEGFTELQTWLTSQGVTNLRLYGGNEHLRKCFSKILGCRRVQS